MDDLARSMSMITPKSGGDAQVFESPYQPQTLLAAAVWFLSLCLLSCEGRCFVLPCLSFHCGRMLLSHLLALRRAIAFNVVLQQFGDGSGEATIWRVENFDLAPVPQESFPTQPLLLARLRVHTQYLACCNHLPTA